MTIQRNNSNINQTFIIGPEINVSGDCVPIYVNIIEPCIGDDILINGNIIISGITSNSISATTYYNLPTDIYITGGTYYNGITTFTNNVGASFNVSGYYTGYTVPIDVTVTGGTYSNGTTTFTNNTGGTFNVTGFTLPFTGGTVSGGIITPNISSTTISATTISATTYYGDGSKLINIPKYWTSGSTGINSIKTNNNSGLDATGDYSIAEGFLTYANGQYSHSEGIESIAYGISSHAEGDNSIANGITSHAQGSNNTANGDFSHAQGSNNIANGNSSHIGGRASLVSGDYSFLHSNQGIINNGATNSAILGGFNSTINTNVKNSVILGGSGLTATQNNTVYGINFSATAMSATTFYGDGSHLSGIITNHNSLTGLQGGQSNQYYHLTQNEYSQVSGDTLNNTYANISGETFTGGITTPSISATTISGTTLYGDGSHITNINSAINGQFVHISGDTMTGNLVVPIITANTLDIQTNIINSESGDVIINDNLKVIGNLIILGSAITANTQTVLIEDNVLTLNYGDTGGTVTRGISGIDVARGTGSTYQFIFQESDDTFRVGMSGSTQAVATRENTPLSNGIAVWDSNNYKFDTTYNISATTITATTYYGNTLNINNSTLFGTLSGGTYNGNIFISQNDRYPLIEFRSSSVIKTQIISDVNLNNLYLDVPGNLIIRDTINGGIAKLSLNSSTGNLAVYGSITTPIISATTYYNLPIDVRVTGGTYSNGIATFTNNTGGTFNVSGLTTPFTGGTISGNIVTPNISATTISGTTLYGDGSHITNINSNNVTGFVHVSGDTMTGNLVVPIITATNIIDNTLSGSTVRNVKVDTTGTLIASTDKQIVSGITGITIVDNIDITTCDAVVWDYVVKSNAGMRAGTITGVWSGNTVEYYEISTNDIGNTQNVNLSVNILSGNSRLIINVTSGTWIIKTNRTIL